MRDVALPSALLKDMKTHARELYPDECCGFLISNSVGTPEASGRSVVALERARNEFEGERGRRFLIPSSELRDVERRRAREGAAVVGFYHSHPDHPARPSAFDQAHAWPWYSYIVLSVTSTGEVAVGAFELDPDSSTFQEVKLQIQDGAPDDASARPGRARA